MEALVPSALCWEEGGELGVGLEELTELPLDFGRVEGFL